MPADRTVVVVPRFAWVMVWVFVPLGCGAGYWLLKLLAKLWESLYWLPFPELVRTAAVLREPYATIVVVAAGVGLGLRLAYRDHRKRPELTVTADAASFKRAGKLVSEIPRTGVTAVFHDLNHLHFLSGRAEVGRFVCELDIDEIKEAFLAHGWPWQDQDPYLAEYQAGKHPDTAVNALLVKRRRVLARKDYWGAVEIRTAIGRLGVVVRDTKNEQQLWRDVPPDERG
jgi:hypothetical protein